MLREDEREGAGAEVPGEFEDVGRAVLVMERKTCCMSTVRRTVAMMGGMDGRGVGRWGCDGGAATVIYAVHAAIAGAAE